MTHDHDLGRAELQAQRFDVVDHGRDRIVAIHGSFRQTTATLIEVDHSELSFEQPSPKCIEMFAALSWSTMEEHDRRYVRRSTPDAVEETDAIQNHVMRPGRERGLGLRSSEGARPEDTDD